MTNTSTPKPSPGNQEQVGTRYPTLGFWTSGVAATKEGYGPQPYETFAFDSALLASQIENFNIMPYSSVLPIDVQIVDIGSVVSSFYHGAVLEVILAQIGITYSTAAAKRNVGIRRHGRDVQIDSDGPVMAAAANVGMQTGVTNSSGTVVGGFVAEYVDYFDSDVGSTFAQNESKSQLNAALDHICTIRKLNPTSGTRTIHNVAYVEATDSLPHAYAMNGFGFLNFEFRPVVSP